MSQLNNMQRPDSQHRPLVAYMTLAPLRIRVVFYSLREGCL